MSRTSHIVQEKWEAKLIQTMGPEYSIVGSHTLAAIHIMVFARNSLIDSIHGVLHRYLLQVYSVL